MNCVPAATAALELGTGWPEAADVDTVGAFDAGSPVSALAASSFGCALPKPHPPSRSRATTGPAHLPLVKPQHAEAQSVSDLQGPVMNCVPWAAAKIETIYGQVRPSKGEAVNSRERIVMI